MYDYGWANTGLAIFFIGYMTLYTTMFFLGMEGMPRRYFDYDKIFHTSNIFSSLGAMIMYFGLAVIIINLFASLKRGARAPSNPWGGKTLEWTIASPPPAENFEEIPVITKGPYHYE